MGSNRKLLSGVLLLVGAVVIFGLYQVVTHIGAAGPPASPTPSAALTNVSHAPDKIARAAVDIPQGTIVSKDMIEMVNITGSGLPTGFVTKPEDQAYGYITSTDIPKGAQIRPAEDFVGHITDVGISGMLRPGMRAVVVPIANKPTLHDLVRVGNYVDINGSFDGQESNTVVQNVRVLAVDVFGNNFPQVNVAMSGPYKADVKAADGPKVAPGTLDRSGAPVDPNAVPTPAPTAAPARPDPALTIEVTPEQAKKLLLAQASGATLDFALLPSAPGGLIRNPSIVGGADGSTVNPDNIKSVSVTKAQIAPYAERKKSPNGGGKTTKVDMGLKDYGKSLEKVASTIKDGGGWNAPPMHGGGTPSGMPDGGTVPPAGIGGLSPVATPPASTYDIPVYGDGKILRVETVRNPTNQ